MSTASPQQLGEDRVPRVAAAPKAATSTAPPDRPVTPAWPNSWDWPPEPGDPPGRVRLPQRAEQEHQRAERLRALGVEPEG